MAVSDSFSALRVLYADIEARGSSICSSQTDWPCRKGCDSCCRHLAEVPRATKKEWDQTQVALKLLPPKTQEEIATRIANLAEASHKPIVCPFLHRESGSCSIYEARPTACRTYGFYVERDQGLYCPEIRSRVEEGVYQQVVWGNAESIDARLQQIGPQIDLLTWWQAYYSGSLHKNTAASGGTSTVRE
ncbi:MAG: YkgJ family cysteine cluster protein [Bryobacteraceae bacterium]